MTTEMLEQRRALLQVLIHECPNQASQMAASRNYKEVLRNQYGSAEADHNAIMLHLTSALYDGLAYGNWPE